MLHSYVTDMAARVTPNTQIPSLMQYILVCCFGLLCTPSRKEMPLFKEDNNVVCVSFLAETLRRCGGASHDAVGKCVGLWLSGSRDRNGKRLRRMRTVSTDSAAGSSVAADRSPLPADRPPLPADRSPLPADRSPLQPLQPVGNLENQENQPHPMDSGTEVPMHEWWMKTAAVPVISVCVP